MPETTTAASVTDVLSPTERAKLLEVKAKAREFSKKEENYGGFDDEFSPNPSISILKPLTIDYEERGFRGHEIQQITKALGRDFEYYSRTRGLEIETPRVKVLQGVIDKMTSGSGIQTRVVIMNKTSEVNAFVTPDGTVFVTQALLNKLDTLDEVAGVLGHELGHLINKTHARVTHSSDSTAPGVKWVHEAGCDLVGRVFMEKAGFNTLEFASGIEKVGGFERDLAHQSSLMRSSTSVGGHFFIDSTTAHLKPIPIEDPMDSARAGLHRVSRQTNLEQTRDILIKAGRVGLARPILEKLHPQDLAIIYQEIFNSRGERYPYLKELNSLITDRLVSLGYDQLDASLMILSIPGVVYGSKASYFGPVNIEDSYLFSTVDLFDRAVKRLPEFEQGDLKHRMLQGVFPSKERAASPTQGMLFLMSQIIYDYQLNPNGKGIPITEGSLLDALEVIGSINSTEYTNFEHGKQEKIAQVLAKYIDSNFVNSSEPRRLDTVSLTQFLTRVKDRSIPFSSGEFIKRYYVKPKLRESRDPDGILGEIFKTYLDVFKIPFSEDQFGFKDVDQFFDEHFLDGSSDEGVDSTMDFIRKIRNHFAEDVVNEADRAKYVQYIFDKIDQAKMSRSKPILDELDGLAKHYIKYVYGESEEHKETPEFLEAVRKFNLKTIIAGSLFDSDGDQYYQTMEGSMNQLIEVMEAENIDPGKLSRIQLINLCSNLFKARIQQRPNFIGQYEIMEPGTQSFVFCLAPENLPRFYNLPFIKMALEKEEYDFEAESIGKLIDLADKYFSRLVNNPHREGSEYSLYQDSSLGLLLGPAIAASFDRLLEKGVAITEYSDLYTFVDHYFSSGIRKEEILRGINQRYLESEEVSFDQKVDYLVANLDSVGYEGLTTVVEYIKDINTYRKFRERISTKLESYLDGTITMTRVALADFLSSKLVYNFGRLLETCKIDSSQSVSTRLANEWIDAVSDHYGREIIARYDEHSRKFILSETVRENFRTVGDIFAQLRQLSPIQRFTIAHKALMDISGAFASADNRKVLANVLVSALGLKPGFISDALSAAATDGDAKYIGFPASSMISSMLFNALDLNSIDIESIKIEKKDLFPGSDLETILGSDTRAIVLFGAHARKDPNSAIAHRAQESDQLYYSTLNKLTAVVGRKEEKVAEKQEEENLDPASEAVIRAVQASGALGVRALQLASQFHRFSPTVDKRLSEAFDANPGMDRVRFWENLNKLTTDDPNNQELEQFLQRIELDEFLGGGSLQTTFAATFRNEDGSKRRIVIKRKNPAVLGLLQKTYETADKILKVVSSKEKSSKESQQFAKIALMLIDLSQSWCIADINDKTYVEDDTKFRQTIAKFNQSGTSKISFFAPEKIFTQDAVKSEDRAETETLNRILKDDSLESETKVRLVQALGQFFLYQLRGNSFQDPDGKAYFLVHSDPHIGNYMVDLRSEAETQIGVIDRSLYLKLSEKEVKTLEKLIGKGSPSDFVYSFIELILDSNKDRGIERVKSTARVFASLAKEYKNQVVSGRTDKFALLQTMLTEFTNQKKDVPLRLRLMIRNIVAMQELMKRYGLALEAL